MFLLWFAFDISADGGGPSAGALSLHTKREKGVTQTFGLEHITKLFTSGLVYFFDHSGNKLPDFPLRPRAEAFVAHVDEFTEIHGKGDIAGGSIG